MTARWLLGLALGLLVANDVHARDQQQKRKGTEQLRRGGAHGGWNWTIHRARILVAC